MVKSKIINAPVDRKGKTWWWERGQRMKEENVRVPRTTHCSARRVVLPTVMFPVKYPVV